jgi:hypothetical protein
LTGRAIHPDVHSAFFRCRGPTHSD